MLWTTWFFIALAYYGLFSWLPKIFADRGLDVVQTYGYTLLLAAAQLPGYFSAAWLVERWGRKRTFVTYLSIAALCTFVYGAAQSLPVLLTAAVLMSFFALGAWSSLYAYTPELLPTRMRTTGMGAASGMARVAGVLAPLLGGLLIPVSLGLTLTVYALSFALAARERRRARPRDARRGARRHRRRGGGIAPPRQRAVHAQGAARAGSRHDVLTSNRSRFMTLTHAAAKSRTNFSRASSLA